MVASFIGSLVMVVGVGFLAAAALTFWRSRADPGRGPVWRVEVAIDVLVGLVALGDGAVSTLHVPIAAVVWSVGTVLLFVVGALFLLRRHYTV